MSDEYGPPTADAPMPPMVARAIVRDLRRTDEDNAVTYLLAVLRDAWALGASDGQIASNGRATTVDTPLQRAEVGRLVDAVRVVPRERAITLVCTALETARAGKT